MVAGTAAVAGSDNDVATAKKLLAEGMKELGITKLPSDYTHIQYDRGA